MECARLSGGDAERGTVAELLDAFLVHVHGLMVAGKRAPRTVADNEIEAENLKRSFGHMQQGKLRRKHVAGYLEAALEAKRGVRANREVAFLSSAYSWGMRKFGLEENPCYGVRRNTETPRQRVPEGVGGHEVRQALLPALAALLRALETSHRMSSIRSAGAHA